VAQEKCQCRSADHGHKPGECKNEAIHKSDQMCHPCHSSAAKESKRSSGGKQ
jgi:hypothetical protein